MLMNKMMILQDSSKSNVKFEQGQKCKIKKMR